MDSLSSQRVHIWHAAPEHVSDQKISDYCRLLLSPEERARATRYRFQRDRHMFVASRALLRHALSQYNSANPNRWSFRVNRYGKPSVVGPSAASDLRFNLTHTEGLLAVAVTCGREIGIDAEHQNREVAWRSLAPTIFTDHEVAHLDSLDEVEQRICFFRYWTLKEAFVKARGKGLSLSLQEFHFVLSESSSPRVEFVDPALGQSGDWQFFLFDEFPNHQLALAVEGGQDVAVSLRPGIELL